MSPQAVPVQKVCKNCGWTGVGRIERKGSAGVEVLLWLFFIIPGVIYTAWRGSTRHRACPQCGQASLIPVSSPMGQKPISELSKPAGLPPEAEKPDSFLDSIGRTYVPPAGDPRRTQVDLLERTYRQRRSRLALGCLAALGAVVLVGLLPSLFTRGGTGSSTANPGAANPVSPPSPTDRPSGLRSRSPSPAGQILENMLAVPEHRWTDVREGMGEHRRVGFVIGVEAARDTVEVREDVWKLMPSYLQRNFVPYVAEYFWITNRRRHAIVIGKPTGRRLATYTARGGARILR
jgi:hypothetical protein